MIIIVSIEECFYKPDPFPLYLETIMGKKNTEKVKVKKKCCAKFKKKGKCCSKCPVAVKIQKKLEKAAS
jgi:hypothetical protein